jgi:hypothetical protein
MERFKTDRARRRFSSPHRVAHPWRGLALGACALLAGACDVPPDAATDELGAAGRSGGPAEVLSAVPASSASTQVPSTASTAAVVAAASAGLQLGAPARLPAAKIDSRLLPTAQSSAPGEVILLLEEAALSPVAGEAAASVPGVQPLDTRMRAFASRLNLAKAGLLGRMVGERLATVKSFENLPAMHLRVDSAEALMALAGDPAVARIVPNEQLTLLTDPADLTLINQPKAAAAGKLGAGTTVAVLDTGTDYTRAPFNCTAAGATGCPIVYAADIAAQDNSVDDNGHGTNVSGIVHSVAPSAQIAALDVFTGNGAYTTDIMTAIDWTITNKAKYNIVSINMSLGGGVSTTTCPTDALAVSIAKARAAGILSAVASGNSGTTNAISSPACSPDAVSVGAVHAANLGGLQWSTCGDATTQPDQIACFSCSSSFLTVLAPGVQITAAGITMSGTSQATPHVAAAIAVLRSAFPSESPTDTVTRLTTYGVPVKDPRNGITKPRIDLLASLNGAAAAPAPTAGPVGTISLNAAAAYTKTAAVTAALATTSGTATQVCLSEAATCTTFVPSAASLGFTLSAGDGKKTVNAWWKNAAGNVSAAPATASIVLDTTAPLGGALTATGTGLQAAFTWSGFTDAGSGMGGYRLVTGTSAAIAAGCQTGTVAYEGTATTFTQTLTAGGTLYARVCGKDALGNISAGIAASVTLAAPAPPVGTIALNAKAAFTKTTAVSATLAVTTGTATQVCLSEAATCTAFVPSAASLGFTLSAGDGKKTVNAWWKNAAGNVSAAPATASIVLDTTAPVGGALTATGTGLQAAFTWSGFTDAGSGMGGYRLVTGTSAAIAAGCQTGTVVYEGTATTFTQTLTAGGTLYARVCGKDALGNMSAGSAASVTLTAPPPPAPVGTIALNAKAAFTKSTAISATLAVTTGTATQVCLSEAATCTNWVPSTTALGFILSTGDGKKTVNAWWKNAAGIASASPASASIVLDTTAPVGGTLTATATGLQAAFTWSGFTDAGSGIGGYFLVTGTTAAIAAGCQSGTVAYEGTATTFTQTLTAAGALYARVCAKDTLGNLSAGSALTVTLVAPPVPTAPITRSAVLVGSDSTAQAGNVTGGTAYNDACPAGQVLTGLGGSTTTTTTAALNRQITGHCGVVQISGATVTIKAGATLPTRGAAGLAPFTRDCPANQVVVGYSGRAGLLVDQIVLTCAPLSSTASAATGAALTVGATTSTLAAIGGTGGTALTAVRCPTGEVATTTRLRAGDNLDAFGLACAKPTVGAN